LPVVVTVIEQLLGKLTVIVLPQAAALYAMAYGLVSVTVDEVLEEEALVALVPQPRLRQTTDRQPAARVERRVRLQEGSVAKRNGVFIVPNLSCWMI
jgi:hypothetical protein